MGSRCPCSAFTLTPFLYPSTCRSFPSYAARLGKASSIALSGRRLQSTINDLPESRLNPAPDDYSSPSFADRAELTLYAGRGGSGCISFLREAYLPEGPPNGGDGGAGGNIFIQAAHGETSLHKIARRRFVRAGRGKNGQGSARGGTRGEDVVITVPVGTIVRELDREDPAAEEALNIKAWRLAEKRRKKEIRLAEEERRRQKAKGLVEEDEEAEEQDREQEEEDDDLESADPERAKWLLYPGMSKSDKASINFPRLPRRYRNLQQPPAPIYLDLSKPTIQPFLLATGGIGGLGNPHFTSKEHPRPLFATKGDPAVTMKIELELKLLADVGLVGLPNAGKSTLLRALTNSRTRVGSWAFTTLQPNIGTVVLDKYSGRPITRASRPSAAENDSSDPRTRFTVADIPGLIEGAHLDRGLGIAFLKHVERAGVLAFVLDLSAANAVKALEALWREVGLYAQMREEEEASRKADARIDWDTAFEEGGGTVNLMNMTTDPLGAEAPSQALHIAGKPWFVVATKADLPETQANYRELKEYVDKINAGEMPHPSGAEDAWRGKVAAIPVSAINGQGVDRIVHWTAGLLEE